MSFTCEFCNKDFATAPSLKTHVNNAKYCLKLREKSKPAAVPQKEKKDFSSCSCEHCGKSFTQKTTLTKHLTLCPKLKKSPPEKSKKVAKVEESQQQKKEIQPEILSADELDFSDDFSEEKSEGEKLMEKYKVQALAIEKDISEKNAKIEKMLGERNKWEKISEKSAMIEKKMAELDIAKVESVDSTSTESSTDISDMSSTSSTIFNTDYENYGSSAFDASKFSTTYESDGAVASDSTSSSSTDSSSTSTKVDKEWELGKFRYPTKETMEEFKQYYTFELYLQKEEGLVKFMKAMIHYQMFKDRNELELRDIKDRNERELRDIFNKLK